MKKRFIENRLTTLFRNFPAVLLTGARQTGKTTLLKSLVSSPSVVTFDPVTDIQGARAEPDLFLQNLSTPAFLDEVQYSPEVLASLKRYIDERSGQKSLFYLSGSHNLGVLKGAAESMAGRVAIADLYALCYRELAEKEDHGILEQWLHDGADNFSREQEDTDTPAVNRLMWRGSMPGILDLGDEVLPDYFSAYLRTYIERDIRSMAGIQDIGRFGRFVRLLSALSAQEINANQLGRELGIDRTTALRWVSLCESSYQWIQIPAFSRNSVKKISGKNKGYFTDTGFLCALQGIFSPQILASHPLYGHIFETYIVMEVIKRTAAWMQRPSLHHYRTYQGTEVDLILEYNGTLFPMEIKLTAKPSAMDARGIQSLRTTFPKERIGCGLIVCSTPKAFPIQQNIWAVPWWEL